MTEHDCTERFREYKRVQDRILDQDLEALKRLPEHERIERYNDLKRQEAAFDSEFLAECADFLTASERERMRGEFQLARLLLVASFYAEDNLPQALADEFTTAELDAVVAFDRYSVFDTLSEEEIEHKIRRMDGEVYDLVAEYTSTQLANIEALTEQSDIQQAVVDRLLARYEERREKIRRGFFAYVEAHGLEHVVATIEDAIQTVADAADERSAIQARLEATVSQTSQPTALDVTLRDIESEISASVNSGTHGDGTTQAISETEASRDHVSELTAKYETAIDDLETQLDQLNELEARIEAKVDELTQVRERTTSVDREAAQQATDLIDAELEALRQERSGLQSRHGRVELLRKQLKYDQRRFSTQQHTVTSAEDEDDINETIVGDSSVIDNTQAVSAPVARLMEMDYLGRFDISMNNVEEITTPDGSFTVPDEYWETRSERRSERTRLARLLDEAGDPSQYPLNQTARYEITEDRYFGLSQTSEMIIEASVYTSLESHARAGFDRGPADFGDLLRFVNDAVYEAEWRDCTYLMALASPTGWKDGIRERFTDDVPQSRFSQTVSVCLVDLQTGELIYDDTDPVVAENVHVFEPAVESEYISAAVETIRENYLNNVGTETIALQTAVNEHEYDSQVVSQAFHRLADSGDADLLYVDDLGLCLEVSG